MRTLDSLWRLFVFVLSRAQPPSNLTFPGESDSIEITGPITAGSSTYDRVLKKTGDGAAKEACYGEVSKARATATSLGKRVNARNQPHLFPLTITYHTRVYLEEEMSRRFFPGVS